MTDKEKLRKAQRDKYRTMVGIPLDAPLHTFASTVRRKMVPVFAEACIKLIGSMPDAEVADQLGVSEATITRYRKRLNMGESASSVIQFPDADQLNLVDTPPVIKSFEDYFFQAAEKQRATPPVIKRETPVASRHDRPAPRPRPVPTPPPRPAPVQIRITNVVTKFIPSDIVWRMSKNKAVKCQVLEVSINIGRLTGNGAGDPLDFRITYGTDAPDKFANEGDLFHTLEDLMGSLVASASE